MRKRGLSHEVDLLLDSNLIQSPAILKNSSSWIQKKYESLDSRLIDFLDYLNEDKDNQSQLITDFQEYYFGEKPVIPED